MEARPAVLIRMAVTRGRMLLRHLHSMIAMATCTEDTTVKVLHTPMKHASVRWIFIRRIISTLETAMSTKGKQQPSSTSY